MKSAHRVFKKIASSIFIALALVTQVSAQTYPNRPIRLLVRGSHRAKVASLVKQGGVDCRWRGVNETIPVERIEQHFARDGIQGQRRA